MFGFTFAVVYALDTSASFLYFPLFVDIYLRCERIILQVYEHVNHFCAFSIIYLTFFTITPPFLYIMTYLLYAFKRYIMPNADFFFLRFLVVWYLTNPAALAIIALII